MKKMFLSLATIAFVAVGSLTMTSCGSDDSTTNPGGENPGGENPGGGDGDLKSNYVEWDAEKYKLEGSLFEIQGKGSGQQFQPSLFTLKDKEGYWLRYYTTYWKGDMEAAEEIADLAVYGMVSFYVEAMDVELNDQGQVVNYKMTLPNEAEVVLPASGRIYMAGEDMGAATQAGITINTFVMTAGKGTASFDGQSVHGSAGTAKFTYDGESGFASYVPSSKGKSLSNLDIKQSLNDDNLAKEVKSLKVVSLK